VYAVKWDIVASPDTGGGREETSDPLSDDNIKKVKVPTTSNSKNADSIIYLFILEYLV